MVRFEKWGWLYRPANLGAWILIILGAIFLVSVYFTYEKHARGTGDLIYRIYPHFVATFLLYIWVGYKTSK
ncbi:hypothetical protein A2708_02510 [Candidatus Saccharibacteria bacterium RIFCSPHIGHO2_01_FULL_49_21]|nr:MAG: hypothetical protein A2708_02510 [Candidatus Saccharibacteria bacterium RIFCSPHIGHO2_01_FULL_49_21]OGL37823.1 MAG: hypothetical protein A3B63_00035 [Candidatus Saccharibacteria bacterium RIFCSPLOWO2_01_FULL_49_22]